MPTRKSSEKASTTDKVFSHEQIRDLPLMELVKMKRDGWRTAEPTPAWGSYNYEAPGFDPEKDMISPSEGNTYVAGTVPNLPTQASPELEGMRADPEMQQMAAKIGVSVNDLALLRQMSLDKYGQRYNPPQQDEQHNSGNSSNGSSMG